MGPSRVGVAVVVVGLCLSGCGPGFQVTRKVPKAPPSLTTVFVYPVQLTGVDAPSWRQNELGQRVVEALLPQEAERFSFFGPTEFQVTRPSEDNAWVASNALPLLIQGGNTPEQGLVLRSIVERRRMQQTNEADDLASGKRKGAALVEETTWVARVEALHPSTKEVLVEVQGQAHVDPFAEAPADADFDEAPLMTHLVENLALRAMKELRALAAVREAKALPDLETAMTPASLVGFSADDPSTLVTVAKLDAATSELFLQNRTRMLTPKLTEAQAQKLAHARTGVLVLSAQSGGLLTAGDFVEQVEGRPATPQGLQRARFATAGTTIRVRKPSGDAVDVPFP